MSLWTFYRVPKHISWSNSKFQTQLPTADPTMRSHGDIIGYSRQKNEIRKCYVRQILNKIIDAIRKKASDPPPPQDTSTSESSRPSRERRRPPPPIRVEERRAPETATSAPKPARTPSREIRRSRPTTPLTPGMSDSTPCFVKIWGEV
eukprot:sb/3473737/